MRFILTWNIDYNACSAVQY